MYVVVMCSLFTAAIVLMMYGHYTRRITALEENPVVKVKMIPRNQYDDQMGIDWTSEASPETVTPYSDFAPTTTRSIL